MKKFLVILCASVLLLCSCQGEKRDDYVPAGEWTGAETDAYAEYMGIEECLYVKLHPEGTPIPPHDMTYHVSGVYEPDRFEFYMEQEEYSLSELTRDSVIYAMFRLKKAPDGEEDEWGRAHVLSGTLLERFNGEEWERLIYIPNGWGVFQGLPQWATAEARDTVFPRPIELDRLATKLTPGKYRAVICVNYDYDMLYAEFELTE